MRRVSMSDYDLEPSKYEKYRREREEATSLPIGEGFVWESAPVKRIGQLLNNWNNRQSVNTPGWLRYRKNPDGDGYIVYRSAE